MKTAATTTAQNLVFHNAHSLETKRNLCQMEDWKIHLVTRRGDVDPASAAIR